ncbi:MAG: RdgB/HAM1 family non-canonical purine NTP pyrophosphatase [Rhodospirillales bacterium]|nr:RdgB/HAM1 family non-canonical purine NTP pyrophosphatase [Alphaproteobacteria bacterium]USO03618.1 MAG: RdgB/HAM1 family non-canonical purine NTP pyrophosphatase [Rhodospirillales bacterium]
MNTLLLATHNQGKIREFEGFLSPLGIALKSAEDFKLPEPEETGKTFAENAILKAQAACDATGLPCLADDSGLVIDALDGAPGIYSARWAGPEKDFKAAMQRVHDELGGMDGTQTARFVAVLALVLPDGTQEVFDGTAEGVLTWPMRGENGFGYDPFFVPEGYEITFGEMEPSQKKLLSHRAKAVEKFLRYLKR